MAFDSERNRVTLFGGTRAAGTPESDTWSWDGADWSQVEDTGPNARSGHGMAYDAARSRIVLFGGHGADLATSFGDTWEWDGKQWKRVQDIGPAPATGAAMVFRTRVCELFGGVSAIDDTTSPSLFGLTWEWNGVHWTARQDMGVGARTGHAMAFDSARGRVVLFGGQTLTSDEENAAAGIMGDTWEHADILSGQAIAVVSIDAQPNPVWLGETLEITVEIASPAPVGGAPIEMGGELFLEGVVVPAGTTVVTIPVPIPTDVGDMPLPWTGTVTASSGGVTVSVEITVQEPE